MANDICGNYLIYPWNSFSSARKRAFTYIHTLCYQCCSNKLLPNSFSSLRPPIFSPKFVPLWMLSICWWWSWSGEALLFLFNLFFLELIWYICPNWCWVFVGHDLGQVQPLIFWNKICLQLMLNICSNWCWVLLVVILVRCSPFSFQHDFSWIRFKYLCQLMSSICWSWSWSGAGCSSPPPAHQSPKTCPQETATAPFASPVFFSQIFFSSDFPIFSC